MSKDKLMETSGISETIANNMIDKKVRNNVDNALKYMKQNNIKVREIYIHSTHLEGVKEMEKFIKYNFKDVDYLYCPYSE